MLCFYYELLVESSRHAWNEAGDRAPCRRTGQGPGFSKENLLNKKLRRVIQSSRSSDPRQVVELLENMLVKRRGL
jgi:hypothetical protein